MSNIAKIRIVERGGEGDTRNPEPYYAVEQLAWSFVSRFEDKAEAERFAYMIARDANASVDFIPKGCR